MYLIHILLQFVTASSVDTVRHLDFGSFRGREGLYTIDFFNIPFAAPPVGSLRFRKPRPPLNLTMLGIQDSTISGILNLFILGVSCMNDIYSELNVGNSYISEDCLQLNVIIPKNAKPGDNLPVYGFVFGGKVTIISYFSSPMGLLHVPIHGDLVILSKRAIML
jgi:carboxylesterase type B